MAFRDLPLCQIGSRELEGLIANEERESRSIEYKSALPGRTDGERSEFLADVSSFANAGGGDLLYGMKTRDGVPVEICGVGSVDLDAEVLRLESMMRDGIDPRMPGIQCRPITGANGTSVIAIRVPASWAGPHMVSFKQHSRFFSRNSGGKYQLDVREIRAAFVASEAVSERIRRFRLERIGKIIAHETPVRLVQEAVAVLHFVPIAAFSAASRRDIVSEGADFRGLQTLCGSVCGWRFNFDGILVEGVPGASGEHDSYTQLFRDGCIEAVGGSFLDAESGKPGSIPSVYFEQKIIEYIEGTLQYTAKYAISPPILVMLTLVGVRGFSMFTSAHLLRRDPRRVIDREILDIPEVIIGGENVGAATLMRPCFDAVWNACGYARSENYAADGTWRPR